MNFKRGFLRGYLALWVILLMFGLVTFHKDLLVMTGITESNEMQLAGRLSDQQVAEKQSACVGVKSPECETINAGLIPAGNISDQSVSGSTLEAARSGTRIFLTFFLVAPALILIALFLVFGLLGWVRRGFQG